MQQTLGILLYDHVQALDAIGPWEVFSFWQQLLEPCLKMYFIAEQEGLVVCDNAITLKAHTDFLHAPPLDFLVVPGGRGRLAASQNPQVLQFLKQRAVQAKYILSVCTGAFLLHAAGLLDGQNMTTYWRALPEMQSFKDANIVEARIVKNEKIWLSGGVSSGIDLALAFIAHLAGDEAAGKVQLLLEYFPAQTVFGSSDLFKTLPLYREGVKPATLPAYIQKYMCNRK